MEDALIAVCWHVTAGHLQHSCRQFCRHNAGGGPLMEGIVGYIWLQYYGGCMGGSGRLWLGARGGGREEVYSLHCRGGPLPIKYAFSL